MKSPLRWMLVGSLLLAAPAWAQEALPADAAGAEKKKDEEKPKTIAEVTKDSDRLEGLFTVFRDRKTGDLRLLVRADQLDRTFFYFSYCEDGVAVAGHFRGEFDIDSAKVFTIRRYFNRLEFIVENESFYFEPGTPIARAAGGNTSHAVVADEKIEADDAEQGLCLINANALFLRETFTRIAYLPDPTKPAHEVYSLGTLSATKSKIRQVRNYPQNTDVVVEYVYENDKPYVDGGAAITDARMVSIKVQHSFIAAPAEPCAPRYDDPRVGFFGTRVTDLSAVSDATPYRDTIARWHLVKRDPGAAVSEPVEPIVFWMENTTPLQLRPLIERAALTWNEAFLAAGFKNALVIKTQPDDADWDAGDLRYNVIRWMASPTPFFAGFGPSFYDPRDGRILGADIVLEYSSITDILDFARAFGPPAPAANRTGPSLHRGPGCTAGAASRPEYQFAQAMLTSFGAPSAEHQRALDEWISYLVIHELGHTLGLSHNFRSSRLHPLADIYDPAKTGPLGLCGSIMDYPCAPFAPPGKTQGAYWPTKPGPYDTWAITYAYSPALDDPAAEAARLAALLARSTEPALAFGNDADDMRDPGKAIDPRVNIFDLTSDPIGFARDQFAVVEAVVPQFTQRLTRAGDSYQALLNGELLAVGRYWRSASVVSRFIGGVQVDRAMNGQPGAGAPLTPVSLAEQRRAMQILREKIFSPGAFAFVSMNADHLLAQRRGWDHGDGTEDPKLHDAVLEVQRDVLDHLLHAVVLKRLTDTRAYGNGYTAYAVIADLTDAVFADDLRGDVNTRRQDLQVEFTKRLLAIVDPAKDNPYDSVAQSAALDRLRWIQRQLGAKTKANAETAAHRASVLYRIQRGLDDPAK